MAKSSATFALAKEPVDVDITRKQRMKFLVCLVLVILSTVVLSAPAAGSNTGRWDVMTERCTSLADTDFATIQDAPTNIDEAKLVGKIGDYASYCQVLGYVAPNVGFVLRLPVDGWNGKFLQLGCAGFCGTTDNAAATGDFSGCIDSVHRGYACVISDNGHTGGGGLWAYNNLQAEIDHAFRGAHVTALAAKAVMEHYYRQAPRKSYFWGCSTGGREAMMEAQRFPWEFDGIIAGDPSLGVPEIHMALLWAGRALTDKAGRPVMRKADLDLLHQAVVAKCDLNDGVADGQIGDPRACNFDISTLLCTIKNRNNCLTAQQIEAARKIYSGPVTSAGTPIYTSIALKGSERGWQHWGVGVLNFANEEFRYSGFQPNPGPTWRSEEFDFDRDYKRIGIAKALYSAVDPDLRQFKAAGGKLLSYIGWNTHIPLQLLDYYETVERTMGGRAATQDFFRLFAVPGMGHCTGGDGAFAVDWLNYLDTWVDNGQAPDMVRSAHVRLKNPDDYFEATLLKFPLKPESIEFSRPVYPYPTRTRYKGTGDPNAAENFEAVEP